MSCGACNCEECEEGRAHDRAMNRSNDMDDSPAPIHRPAWQDVEPANETQAKAWLGYINEVYTDFSVVKGVPMPTLLSMVAQKVPGLRHENYYTVVAQIQRLIIESGHFELRKGKSGGVFRKDLNTIRDIKSGTLPAPIHNVVSVTLADNYTCKGCGNTKLNNSEKSCWSCGREVGT